MPNITLIRSHLFEAIGRSDTDKEFDELCFEFGVEVDDVAKEVIEVHSRALFMYVACDDILMNNTCWVLACVVYWNRSKGRTLGLCDRHSCQPIRFVVLGGFCKSN
jgi:hypothetical protein